MEEEISLQKIFRWLEWISIILSVVVQFAWLENVIRFESPVGLSFALFFISLLLSAWMPKTARWRFVQLLLQTAVYSAATALGPHRRFFGYFLVLGAKAAAILPLPQMVIVAVALLVARTFSGSFSQYLARHLYIRNAVVPHLYATMAPQIEAKLYFVIGLMTICFLGQIVVSERRSRKAQQVLAKQAEQLAIDFERNKIAREVNDNLGNTLATLMIQIQLVAKSIKENKLDKAKELANQSHDSTVRCLQKLRRAVTTIKSLTARLRLINRQHQICPVIGKAAWRNTVQSM